jgi:COMPASS component SWD1
VKELELQQSEKGKTPATKNKSNVKSTKSSSQQMEPATGKNSTFDDEATEDGDVNIDT